MKPLSGAFCIIFSLLSLQAYAQVYRCQAAGGKTTYSNFPCATDEKGAHVRITDNSVESRDLRNYARAQKEREFERKYGQEEAMGEARTRDAGKADSYECKLAIKNASNQSAVGKASPRKIDDDRAQAAQICGYNPWVGQTMVEADAANKRSEALERAARAAERERNRPSTLTNCDGGGCWDDRGNRYNNAAGGNFTRSDGKFCISTGGGLLNCN